MHWTLLLLPLACGDGTQTQQVQEDTAFVAGDDDIPPFIEHDPVSSPQSASGYVTVTATITDDSEIIGATLYFRRQVESAWSTTQMNPQGGDIYAGTITSDRMSSGGMHYYIEAIDQYSNIGDYPDGAPADYLKFDLVE
jgi:hypothetical protein